MAGRGLRSVLQPVLFLGIALALHGLLFLIPGKGPGGRDAGTSRGIRVKTYVDGPPSAPQAPAAPVERQISSDSASTSRLPTGTDNIARPRGGGGDSGGEGSASGAGGPAAGRAAGGGGEGPPSAWDLFKGRLRSAETQGWAERTAQASRRGWKGSGAGSGGWGAGSKTGAGAEAGSGTGSGRGTRGASGKGYMDPRVQMVVIQYPSARSGRPGAGEGKNIESRFPRVPYPDVKVRQSQFTSGWWNVYIELWTTDDGQIARFNVLRPETVGPQERVFVDQVKREVERWSFDPGASEIHIDVRFYVE